MPLQRLLISIWLIAAVPLAPTLVGYADCGGACCDEADQAGDSCHVAEAAVQVASDCCGAGDATKPAEPNTCPNSSSECCGCCEWSAPPATVVCETEKFDEAPAGAFLIPSQGQYVSRSLQPALRPPIHA